jgi:hypothetical protein
MTVPEGIPGIRKAMLGGPISAEKELGFEYQWNRNVR